MFLVYFVSGTHGHAGHVVFLQYCFWVTESRWSRGSRCVFLKRSWAGHIRDQTQNCVFLKKLFRGHRVTLVTWVTLCFFEKIVLGSQSHAGHVGHIVLF